MHRLVVILSSSGLDELFDLVWTFVGVTEGKSAVSLTRLVIYILSRFIDTNMRKFSTTDYYYTLIFKKKIKIFQGLLVYFEIRVYTDF